MEAELNYYIARQYLKRLLKEGLLTKEEFHAADELLASKYRPVCRGFNP